MANEFIDDNDVLPIDRTDREGDSGDMDMGRSPAVAVAIGHALFRGEAMQEAQDEAVRAALQQLIGARLPPGRDIRILLCDHPEAVGIPPASLVAAEMAAYKEAGYGQRAEGLALIEAVFRGYNEHGPLRYAIIVEAGIGGELEVRVFGNYFQVGDGFERLGPEYGAVVEQWKHDHAGLQPKEFIISKLVSDPTKPKIAVGLVGLGTEMTVGILRGLATTTPHGTLVATRTQPDSQAVVRRVLPRMIPGLQILLDQPIEGEGEGGPLAVMLGYIPFSSLRER